MKNTQRIALLLFVAVVAAGCAPGVAMPDQTNPAELPGGVPWQPPEATPYPGSERPPNPPDGNPVAFMVIAEGSALSSGEPKALTLALQAEADGLKLPERLPSELLEAARKALEKAGNPPRNGLFLLIYGGQKPSGGFNVEIEQITTPGETPNEEMLVRWRVNPPDPQKGATTALTYPYLLVWVESGVKAEQVKFEEVK